MVNMMYTNQDIALVHKVEVPRVFDKKAGISRYAGKTGFDYEGIICGSGRFVCVEAKETVKGKLYVDLKGKSGLKIHQIQSLIRYGEANAYSGVLWSCIEVDKMFFLDWMFLQNWMEKVYDKEIGPHTKQPVKSIMLRHVDSFCPNVLKGGLPDYLMQL